MVFHIKIHRYGTRWYRLYARDHHHTEKNLCMQCFELATAEQQAGNLITQAMCLHQGYGFYDEKNK